MDLKDILEKHKLWLNNDANGEIANLRGADLRVADLREADLRGADLRGADLRVANLRVANLRVADLRRANLQVADLRVADLRGADLRGADLRVADLREADLREADLRVANLQGADLRGANLQGAKYLIPMACPDKGSFTAWKKCGRNTIVELLIPEDALRSSATGRKCRASKAIVIDIYDMYTGEHWLEFAQSVYDPAFEYHIGDTVVPKNGFDPDRFNECGPGIHFFITREEAEHYLL